jgi:small-conductance mechanosensitive channel
MERQLTSAIAPGTARDQLNAARQAHDRSLRRATPTAGLILATSSFCGALTVSSSHGGPAHVVTIVALVWFVIELLRLSARNQWRALRSMPKPNWSAAELALIVVAVTIGGFVGPHLLASHSNSTVVSWGLAVTVAIAVAACLFIANASYRHRSSRAWRP